MPNTIVTNKLTDLVALRFLVAAGFVTVGSKEHFKDQMIGKRNGQEYTFVIRDTVTVGEGLALDSTTEKQTITEREVKMALTDFHSSLLTNAIEAVTDVNWDKEVAEPAGGKIANYVVRKAVREAMPKATTVVVGQGFQPLAEAAAHLNSISSEKMYGFVDPKIQAVLTANGQQFNPVGSPDSFYKQGLLGEFHSVEYRGQRFMPVVKVSKELADDMEGAKLASFDATTKTLTITLAASSTATVKAGTPFWIEGMMAADLIGDPTAEQYAFIAAEDATASGTSLAIKVADAPDATVGGTTEIIQADGTAVDFTDTDLAVTCPAEGNYFCGQIRLDGTYEFCTLDKLDASNAESKMGAVEGVKVHENRVVDLDQMTNKTRWDIVAMFGVIERRGVVNVMVRV
jgi:hypothetical protein